MNYTCFYFSMESNLVLTIKLAIGSFSVEALKCDLIMYLYGKSLRNVPSQAKQ